MRASEQVHAGSDGATPGTEDPGLAGLGGRDHGPRGAVAQGTVPGAVPQSAPAVWRAATLTSGATFVLTPAEFAPLLSSYLDEGYKRDSVCLREIRVAWPGARAQLDVTAYAMPSNGRYHFTAMHAMLSVCQVGIVLATIAHGLPAKPGEIYMRDFTIVCRREINRTGGLELCCELLRAQDAADAVLYKIAYDYCAGAFSGTLRCLFPRRPPEEAG
jgi:hypothetical protein